MKHVLERLLLEVAFFRIFRCQNDERSAESEGEIQLYKIVLFTLAATSRRLEALAVDNGGARLVVLLLGDPHLLESGEGSENGSANPDGVFALWGSDDLDLHGGRGKGNQLLVHTTVL